VFSRRKGRSPSFSSEWEIATFIATEMKARPTDLRKAIYGDASKRFGLKRSRILEIWKRLRVDVIPSNLIRD
jgi:hypothetical protein